MVNLITVAVFRCLACNYRGITLLSVVGKVFCKILNDRLVQQLDEGEALHEEKENV